MTVSRLVADVVLEPETCHLRRRTYLLVLVPVLALVLCTPSTKCGRAAHGRLLLVAKPSGACPKPNAA